MHVLVSYQISDPLFFRSHSSVKRLLPHVVPWLQLEITFVSSSIWKLLRRIESPVYKYPMAIRYRYTHQYTTRSSKVLPLRCSPTLLLSMLYPYLDFVITTIHIYHFHHHSQAFCSPKV